MQSTTAMVEKPILDQLYKESLSQLRTLIPEEIEIFQYEELPEHYTVVAIPDDKMLQAIESVINTLKIIEPNQFYYPLKNMHLTIIGGIPMSIDSKTLVTTVEKAFRYFDLRFILKGLASNKYCSSFSAYPVGFSLHSLRENIRNEIGLHGDDYTRILTGYEYVGWMNYLRYLQIPSQHFLDALYSEKDHQFEEMRPVVVRVYRNSSKILDPSHSVLVWESKR